MLHIVACFVNNNKKINWDLTDNNTNHSHKVIICKNNKHLIYYGYQRYELQSIWAIQQ